MSRVVNDPGQGSWTTAAGVKGDRVTGDRDAIRHIDSDIETWRRLSEWNVIGMKHQKLITNLVWTAILASMLLFFLEPHHEYISKIIYVLILVGYGLYQYRIQNLRAVVICAIGSVFVLITLPGFRTVSEIGVILSLVGWGALLYLGKRREEAD